MRTTKLRNCLLKVSVHYGNSESLNHKWVDLLSTMGRQLGIAKPQFVSQVELWWHYILFLWQQAFFVQ